MTEQPGSFWIHCEKMKIALLGTKGIPAKWGGIEKYIEEVSVRLAAMGNDVTVFGSKWYCRGFHEKRYKSVEVVQLPSLQMQATDALSNGALATLSAVFKQFDIANFHGYASYFYLPFFKLLGIKTVVTSHGVESGWDNPKYGTFGRRLLKKAFALGIQNADSVVTVAHHLRHTVKQNFGVDAEVIYSGVDVAAGKSPGLITKKYGLDGNDYIYFIGRIDPIKRVHWLVEMAGILPKDVKLLISGGAQDRSTKRYLDNLVRKSVGISSIIFTGPVTGDEKNELLNNCLCVLVPSKFEGLPITLLEAASYGKSAVASSIPAHKEVIKNGENGFLFSHRDKQAFFNLVQTLLNNRTLLKQTGNTAKDMAKKKFDWEVTGHLYSQLFRRIIDAQ